MGRDNPSIEAHSADSARLDGSTPNFPKPPVVA